MWWVQDLGASLPAKLLGNLTGKRALDMCAAPGGKSAQMALAGAQVTALDRSRKRLGRVADNMKRLRFAADCEVADAVLWQKGKDYDVVLLDAPCTATGTIRRHPDVAWLKDASDVAKLSATQDSLIDAAERLVRTGGIILYCTCSLQPEEGPARIIAALKRHPSLARVPIRPEELFGFQDLVTPDGDLRSLPSHLASLGGIDGFYAARLLKQT
jgi:16S rRNA (cytosine967-C5)-methyltransferase